MDKLKFRVSVDFVLHPSRRTFPLKETRARQNYGEK